MRKLLAIAAVVLTAAVTTAQASPGSHHQQLSQRLHKSESVVRFFDNHKWLMATRKEKCWQVPWQRSCTIARSLYREHSARIPALQQQVLAHGVIQRLNRGLAGTPMAGLGATFERHGREHGISPFFMAAAAGTESSFGAAACGVNGHNAWGLGNCGSAWSVPAFETWDEAIAYYAKFLKSHWPSATTTYSYSGYAACDACWGRKTGYYMSSRFGVGNYTRYGDS